MSSVIHLLYLLLYQVKDKYMLSLVQLAMDLGHNTYLEKT